MSGSEGREASGVAGPDQWLFSYGTLREPAVQLAVFGRTLAGEADALTGFVVTTVEIGGETYLNLQPSGNAGDQVAGFALLVSERELALADAYEDETHYVRVTVRLASGRRAFVYVEAAG